MPGKKLTEFVSSHDSDLGQSAVRDLESQAAPRNHPSLSMEQSAILTSAILAILRQLTRAQKVKYKDDRFERL